MPHSLMRRSLAAMFTLGRPDFERLRVDRWCWYLPHRCEMVHIRGRGKFVFYPPASIDQRRSNIIFRCSGLKINLSKTQSVWIGNKKYSTEEMCESIYLKWTTTFKLLSIFFEVDLTNIPKINNDKKLV